MILRMDAWILASGQINSIHAQRHLESMFKKQKNEAFCVRNAQVRGILPAGPFLKRKKKENLFLRIKAILHVCRSIQPKVPEIL